MKIDYLSISNLRKKNDKINSLYKILYLYFVIAFSLIWAIYIIIFVGDISQDFLRLSKTYYYMRQSGNIFEQFTYSLFGNTLVILWTDLILPDYLSDLDKTYFLYFFASFLRAFILLYFLGPSRGIPLLFAFEVMFDFNQARLSISYSFFMLFLFTNKKFLLIFTWLSHILLIPLSIYLAIKIKHKKKYFTILMIILFYVVINNFNRYFVAMEESFIPTYIVMYLSFSLLGYLILFKIQLINNGDEIYFWSLLGGFFILLIMNGMPPVYFGRIFELMYLFIVTKIGWILATKSNNSVLRFWFYTTLFYLFAYQTLTINGNIWRFFN